MIESQEQQEPQFQISAAVVKQLGEELVSDELTAIMELVKNSYDADADWVKITIDTSKNPNDEYLTFPNSQGYIIIEDNGQGMNYHDITHRWLFISVSHKREMKQGGRVTKKNRTPLGDKGLGRLSTQRLGNILEMHTGTEEDIAFHHVAFDWRSFSEGVSLQSVRTNYKVIPKLSRKSGTKLVVSDLKNASIWNGDDANKFRGQLSKLIFPFKEARPFNVYLNINGESFDLDEINEKLRQQAVSRYSFNFDGERLQVQGIIKLSKLQGNSSEKRELFNKLIQKDNGQDFFNFLIDSQSNKKYFLPDVKYVGTDGLFISFERTFSFEKDIKKEYVIIDTEDGEQEAAANPGYFLGEIDEFNLAGTDEIEGAYNKLSEYKQLVKNQIGVRIFRDGFGIKPYGMEDNDWLKLSKSQTSGGSFYLLRPENVIGFVSITASGNKFLTEKTDREGFIDSAYSRSFFNIVNLAVTNINDVLERTRRSFDAFKMSDAQIKGGIRSFSDTKARLVNTAKQSKEIEIEAKKIQETLKVTSSKVNNAIDRIRKEPLFTNDDEKKSSGILNEVHEILESSYALLEKVNAILQSAKRLEDDASYLEPKIAELEAQIVQFSELAGLGITAEAFTHEVYNILDKLTLRLDESVKQVRKGNLSNSVFYVTIENTREFVRSIRLQLNHLAPSLKYNRETKQQIILSEYLNETFEFYNVKFGDSISLDRKIIDDFSIFVNKGKLTQIVDNILLNSEYWVKQRQKVETGNFHPQITIEINEPFIVLYDNGYGIAPDFESVIFQPFVTTKPRGEGRGLGLFIVQQLLESMDASVQLLQKRNEVGRRYAFQIDLSNNQKSV